MKMELLMDMTDVLTDALEFYANGKNDGGKRENNALERFAIAFERQDEKQQPCEHGSTDPIVCRDCIDEVVG